ncbi:MAG: DNA polymerase III subunit delta [Clostridiales bacterium]|nr:DNA polymerase III subunit delta [Clostridiales bacterium]
MKFTEFKNGLMGGEVHPIYLFEGEDSFFKKRGIDLLRSKFVTEPTLNFARFEGGAFTISELLSSLQSYPFMSEKRITLVSEHNFTKDELKGELKSYFDSPLPESILIITTQKAQDGLKKFPSVAVVDCSKAEINTLTLWVKAECSKEGVGIDMETAKTLCEYCLSDMTRIETETLKLISYVGSGGSIKIADVESMVARDTDHKIYEMTDFIGKKRFDKALSVLSDMMSKGETPQRLIVSIYNYFRRLLHVAISVKQPSEIAELLGIKEFAVKKAKEQAKMFKVRALKKTVDSLSETDYLIKNGNLEQTEALWLNLFKIMTGE